MSKKFSFMNLYGFNTQNLLKHMSNILLFIKKTRFFILSHEFFISANKRD